MHFLFWKISNPSWVTHNSWLQSPVHIWKKTPEAFNQKLYECKILPNLKTQFFCSFVQNVGSWRGSRQKVALTKKSLLGIFGSIFLRKLRIIDFLFSLPGKGGGWHWPIKPLVFNSFSKYAESWKFKAR